jgi:SAM-dependent methyltransferase
MPDRRQFFSTAAGVVPVACGTPLAPPARTPTGSFWEPLDRQMIDWLGVKATDTVLDAGCGKGDHLGPFAELAAAVSGLDLKGEALDTARQRLKAHPRAGRVTFHEGDVLNPPFKTDSFDLVWTSHVLHILKDPVAGAKALAGTLRRGGRLAVREDGAHTWMLPLDTGVGRPGLESRLNAVFTERFVDDRLARGRVPFGWTEVLRKAGLKEVRQIVPVRGRSAVHRSSGKLPAGSSQAATGVGRQTHRRGPPLAGAAHRPEVRTQRLPAGRSAHGVGIDGLHRCRLTRTLEG